MILAHAEAGRGPPVALLHGLFGRGRNLAGVRRRLALRHRAILLDLPNHGESPRAAWAGYGGAAAAVAGTLRALGAAPCALVGHSMGGKVAMRLALDEPALVTRLLVSDIAPRRYPPAFRGVASAMLSVPEGASRAEAEAALSAAVPEAALRAFLLANRRPDGSGWAIGLGEIAAALPGIEGWEASPGARYGGPALFVRGGRSDYLVEADRALVRGLFPAARFATVKGAGHWVHAEAPEAFAALAEGFLG